MRVRDLIGESVRVSWREGGIVCPLDDQGDYLDLQQPLPPPMGWSRRWPRMWDAQRTCYTEISRLAASSTEWVP